MVSGGGDGKAAAALVREGHSVSLSSNTDMTIPTSYGLAPGHGVLVQTITGFAGSRVSR